VEKQTDTAIHDDEIDLREYWRVINQRKWAILVFSLLVALAALLVVFSMRPIYIATATVLIESPQKNASSLEEMYGLERVGSEFFKTQVEILKSRELAERVVDEMKLVEHAEYAGERQAGFRASLAAFLPFLAPPAVEPSAAEKRKQVVQRIMASVSVSDVRNTQLAKLSFESHDPELSARIANKMVDAYVEYNFDTRLTTRDKSLVWLNERLGPLKAALSESEKKLQQYREQQGLVDVEGVRSLVAKELNEITIDFVEARTKRAQLENVLRQADSGKDWMSDPAVVNHPAMQKLVEQRADAEQQLAELGKRYGPKHPKMVAAQNQLKAVDVNVRQQLGTVMASIKKDYAIAKNNEQALQRSLDRAKAEVQNINRKEHQLRELEREVSANRQVYEAFFTRFQETGALGDFDQVNVRLAESAVPPNFAAKPRKKLIVALAFMASLMFAVMMAFFLEFINNGVRRPDDVERQLVQRLLAVVPAIKFKQEHLPGPKALFSREEFRSLAESMRAIRTSMRSGVVSGEGCRITLVTSSLPGEGKTTVSSSLAFAFGQLEKVLLIDADLRKPSVHKMFSISSRSRGLSNLIVGEANVRDFFKKQEESNVTVLPAGSIPSNPAELLSNERFVLLLKKLSKYYDRIIIDSPPVHAVSDALVIARLVNEIVYVVKADATPVQIVRDGLSRLQQNGGKVTGVVLNHYDVRQSDYYEYYYGQNEYGAAKN